MWVSDTVFLIKNRIVRSNTALIVPRKGSATNLTNSPVKSSQTKVGADEEDAPAKCILIDPGTIAWSNLRYLFRQLKLLKLNRIHEIWLTHAHPDHAQAVEFFKRRAPRAGQLYPKVLCHPIAKKILEHPHPINAFLTQQKESISPLLTELFTDNSPKTKTINAMIRVFCRWGVNVVTMHWRKTKVDAVFKNGEKLDFNGKGDTNLLLNENGIKVIYLPGHTPEEIGFYIQDEKILITGDLIAHRKRTSIVALNLPASNISDALNSLKLIQQLEPKLIIPAHGQIITNPKQTIKECIERTEKLREQAHQALRNSSTPYQVLTKWWRLYPPGCSLQQRIRTLGILAKSAILEDSK